MDVVYLTIAELSRAYDAKELSPVEVTRALLDRIAKHDRQLDSFIRVTEDIALADAKAAETELMAGKRRGPMHGIPYGLKDIVETAGIPTTGHSKLRQHHVPKADAEIVRRLKAGGGILMGKLATWEFANGGPSFDLPWPPARNPWDRNRLPGGSSSGPAAAVAAGFVPAAIGTDTGGSIRGPAALCGITGLKPTYGRVSRRGVFPNTFTMDHAGPMTRSAEDIALMLQVIAGSDPADPSTENCPVPDYAAALGRGIKGLRLGLVEGWHEGAGAHPDLGPAIAEAVSVLETCGATVEPVGLSSLRDYTDCKTTISLVELYSIHEPDLRTRPQDFGRILRNHILAGGLVRAEEYQAALRWRTALAKEQAAVFKRVDALITASARTIADIADPDRYSHGIGPSITQPFSISGTPALAIPCGFSRAEGMPLSLQIAAGPFHEPAVLRIGHAFQQATDWHRRHPVLEFAKAAE